MGSLVGLALAVAACSGSVGGDPEAGDAFPPGAFDDPEAAPLVPRPTPAEPAVEPAASRCPGVTTCRRFVAGEAREADGGAVVVTYRVNPTGAAESGLSRDEIVGAIRAAARTWEHHAPAISLRYTGVTGEPPGTSGVIGFGVCGHGRVPACADLRQPEATITFSMHAPWTWRSCGPGGDGSRCDPYPQDCFRTAGGEECRGVDLQAVATHEFGHVLGLDDLHEPTAEGLTMYSFAAVTDDQGALVRRDLSTLGLGDVAGLEALYPGFTVARPIVEP